MTYSATLDFNSIFDSTHTCPGCGSSDIVMSGGRRVIELRCRSCGSAWQLLRSAAESEVAPAQQVG